MLKCRDFRESALDALSGSLPAEQRKDLGRHLADCPACRAHFETTKKAYKIMDQREPYDPGEKFWAGYWDRLQARMAAEESAERTPAPVPGKFRWPFAGFPRWIQLTGAAAALVAAGIFIGRSLNRPGFQADSAAAGPAASVQAAAAESDLSGRTSLYIERSKRILLAVVNFATDPKDIHGLNLPAQRSASNELVREAAALKSELRGSKKRQLERLVGDLERILLQIANLQGGDDLSALGVIKAGAETSDILFKIDLAELNAASRASSPRPGTPRPKTL